MKPIILVTILLLIVLSCSEKSSIKDKQSKKFTSELTELKEYFKIPGLAVSIEKEGKNIYTNYLGFSDMEKQITLDSTALFPIASITKVFSGVLLMKLAEEHKIDLDESINKYLPEKYSVPDSILIKHIVSHTSQGKVGENFYYSSRFGLLTNVIEQASGKKFVDVMNETILMPLKLKNTFLLKDSTQITQENSMIAKPYILDNGIENGFIDFGYSTSAGIVSNLDDLTRFIKALDNNELISKKSKDLMYRLLKMICHMDTEFSIRNLKT